MSQGSKTVFKLKNLPNWFWGIFIGFIVRSIWTSTARCRQINIEHNKLKNNNM